MEKLTLGGLQELFGRAIMAKAAEAPTKSMIPGKRRLGVLNHPTVKILGHEYKCEMPHPAGTKLVRSFIRGSGRESTYNRALYAHFTGHQYHE